jgi:sulfate permease, SulP family
VSPEGRDVDLQQEGPSALSRLLARTGHADNGHEDEAIDDDELEVDHHSRPATQRWKKRPSRTGDGQFDEASERTPLLRTISNRSQPVDSPEYTDTEDVEDVENQKPRVALWRQARLARLRNRAQDGVKVMAKTLDPKSWDRKVIWRQAVLEPLSCLPAVILGLLLNILDALSYGKISLIQILPRLEANIFGAKA